MSFRADLEIENNRAALFRDRKWRGSVEHDLTSDWALLDARRTAADGDSMVEISEVLCWWYDVLIYVASR